MGGEMAVTDRQKGDNGGPVGCQASDSHQGDVGAHSVGPSDWLMRGGMTLLLVS